MEEAVKPAEVADLLRLAWDVTSWSFSLTVSAWLVLGAVLIVAMTIGWRWLSGGFSFRKFEIDQAEFGVGQNKLSFRPNLTDRQIAYAIWVELSTRKIGLPIDFEHDVISEIYDSWFNFFSVTRELIKGVPVSKFKSDSTQAVIKLSIEVLNEGLRPHLTQWQARFRRWYESELKKYDDGTYSEFHDPQDIQEKFPRYEELKTDMLKVNDNLIKYRKKMRELVLKD